MRHAFRGRVGAMSRAEGVIDVEVRKRRQLLGEGWIVRLLLSVKAHVLEQKHVANRHR